MCTPSPLPGNGHPGRARVPERVFAELTEESQPLTVDRSSVRLLNKPERSGAFVTRPFPSPTDAAPPEYERLKHIKHPTNWVKSDGGWRDSEEDGSIHHAASSRPPASAAPASD